MNLDIIKEDLTSPYALIFVDLDGCIIDCTHRLPYLKNKEYDKFYGCSMADDVIDPLNYMSVLSMLYGLVGFYKQHNLSGIIQTSQIVVNTGRPEKTRSLTMLWLHEYAPTFYNLVFNQKLPNSKKDDNQRLLMRSDTNWNHASLIKEANMNKWIARNLCKNDGSVYDASAYDIYVIDDDPRVVSHLASKTFGPKTNVVPSVITLGNRKDVTNYERSMSPEE